MPQVECSRCKRSADGLERPPLPGEVGQAVAAHTCVACWKEWLAAQVMLINEQGLSPANPEHYQRLVDEMRVFLVLEPGD
ncbi:MAG: oxidative damage protection protein [Acidobacteria bacterium]|nr:oxidative damage protection protein [Acidobacteriota bacterium]NIM62111.1 oxidative damage protection protein [Acidobacteriota bacterium]NIO59743.1 oxidative damage protection protein [Acidobacteriota bacterium]NIQ30826.1 oxidative damage protection protein [Acidobacteriota bacterium]NIQ85899.1 oxidative damage protection protein [Acidobacteriota bacterium]